MKAQIQGIYRARASTGRIQHLPSLTATETFWKAPQSPEGPSSYINSLYPHSHKEREDPWTPQPFPSGFWDGSWQLLLTSDHQGAEVASSVTKQFISPAGMPKVWLSWFTPKSGLAIPSPVREGEQFPTIQAEITQLFSRLCGPTQCGNEAKPDKCPFRLIWLHLCDLPAPFPAPLWHCPWRVFLHNNHQTPLTTAGK